LCQTMVGVLSVKFCDSVLFSDFFQLGDEIEITNTCIHIHSELITVGLGKM